MRFIRMLILVTTAALFLCTAACGADGNDAARDLFDSFVAGYKALRVPEFSMSPEENFRNIPSQEAIEAQQQFFALMRDKLARIDRRSLDTENRYLCDGLLYEIEFNVARLRLEKQYRRESAPSAREGLCHMPDGKEWYRLYIRRWASKKMTPEEVRSLGGRNMARVIREIEAIQKEQGFEGRSEDFYRHLGEPSFRITDRNELRLSLEKLQDRVFSNLADDFECTAIPRVGLKILKNPDSNTPPGYYEDGVFYSALHDSGFPGRSLEWLFLHEAVPGHHYQMQLSGMSQNRPAVRALFWYPGFSEGWATYAEDLGKDLGCYRDPYFYLGKWEWDLVRSARLVLDVGIHHQGWTRNQALAWWNDKVPGQKDISEREVDRIFRWPAQSISYKAGEDEILSLRARAAAKAGNGFDLRKLHSLVLQRGSIPLPLLREIVSESYGFSAGEPTH